MMHGIVGRIRWSGISSAPDLLSPAASASVWSEAVCAEGVNATRWPSSFALLSALSLISAAFACPLRRGGSMPAR